MIYLAWRDFLERGESLRLLREGNSAFWKGGKKLLCTRLFSVTTLGDFDLSLFYACYFLLRDTSLRSLGKKKKDACNLCVNKRELRFYIREITAMAWGHCVFMQININAMA